MSVWNWVVNFANAQAALASLGKHYDGLYDKMVGKLGESISKWNIWQKMFDEILNVTKQLVKESRELLAISTRYDIPIEKMGELQMMAQMTGQSVGQVARNFRFLEMNISRALLRPGGPQSAAFRELGVSQEQLNAGAKDTAGFFEIIRQKTLAIGEEEVRNNMLQQMFGANWQQMLPLLEANKTQMRDIESFAYGYNDAMVRALATVEQNNERNQQSLKPLANIFGILYALLQAGITAAVVGVSALAKIITGQLVTGWKLVVGTIKEAIGYAAKLAKISIYTNPALFAAAKLGGVDKIIEQFSNSMIEDGGKDRREGARRYAKDISNPLNALNQQDFDRMEAARDSMALAGFGLEAAFGGNDGDIAKPINAEIQRLENLIKAGTATELQFAQMIRQNRVEMKDGFIDREREMIDAANQNAATLQKAQMDLARVNRLADRAGVGKKTPATSGARTQEQIQIDIERAKNKSQIDAAMVMARTAMAAEIETVLAIKKQKLEIKKIEEEIAIIKDEEIGKGLTPLEEVQYAKKLEMAKIELMQKEKEHQYFLHKKDVQHIEAQRDRREELIDSLEKRQQTYMARQGMTGMDKASVAVSQAIDQMKRDQVDMERILADPAKDAAAKEAARSKVDKSAIKAQEQLDKLSLMQFQYGASDAAKKGMGGGIDIRENQLTVAKSQLDILKRQLDLMLLEAGITREQYGNAPMIMKGPYRVGK